MHEEILMEFPKNISSGKSLITEFRDGGGHAIGVMVVKFDIARSKWARSLGRD